MGFKYQFKIANTPLVDILISCLDLYFIFIFFMGFEYNFKISNTPFADILTLCLDIS